MSENLEYLGAATWPGKHKCESCDYPLVSVVDVMQKLCADCRSRRNNPAPEPSNATPPLAADHAQARSVEYQWTERDGEVVAGNPPPNHAQAREDARLILDGQWDIAPSSPSQNLARAYLALAASPGEGREPEAQQPTMAAMRLLRDEADFRATCIARLAERDARNMGFPSLADVDVPAVHEMAAEQFVEIILEAANQWPELRRTPPAAPAVGVTEAAKLLDLIHSECCDAINDERHTKGERSGLRMACTIISRHYNRLTAALRGTEG